MKLINKQLVYGVVIALITFTLTSPANAQQIALHSATDNFTSFTPEKNYEDIGKLIALTPAKYRNNPDFGKRLNDSATWYEQINKRTLTTRTYTGPGSKVIIEQGYGNLNYIDANGWMRAVNTKLKPSANGWSAVQQEIPVYLYHDASTALSLGGNEIIIFNKNVGFNQSTISANDYTVGDNGIYIKNVAANTDKTVRFGRGRIETDYKIKQPLKLKGDLVISEDIILPATYTISSNINYNPETEQQGSLVVKSIDGKIVAELKAPFCYDRYGKSIVGTYQVQKQSGGYRLTVNVPAKWLNDSMRRYPVTIDPVVTGPVTVYSGPIIPSCVYPGFDTTSMVDTIPPGITVTNFYVVGNYYTPYFNMRKHGFYSFSTSCSLFGPLIYPGDSAKDIIDTPGWLIVTGDLFNFGATYCYVPSCSPRTFRLRIGLARDSLDTNGCNANYLFYDPANTDGSPWECYVVGNTVQSSFTLPTSVCTNQCTFNITVSASYGVPPYTIIHPWGRDTSFGVYNTFNGTSKAGIKYRITIPNCHDILCHDSTLSVPPPLVIDACNDTVKGIIAQTLTLKGLPNVTATPDSQTICSGTNVNILLSSCDSVATYAWTSSEGESGLGTPITNAPSNNGTTKINVTYTVTSSANGCAGNPTIFPVTVNPFNVVINPANPAICPGGSIMLTASGSGNSYSWQENSAWITAGLSCTLCVSPIANPTATTTYHVYGTNGTNGCSAVDSVIVVVNPDPSLTVSGDTTIFSGQSAQLSSSSNDSVTWSPAVGLSCTACSNPVATPTVTTYYFATSTEGVCTLTEAVLVKVIQPCEAVHVPSAFTPAAETNNRLHVLNYGKVSLQVFRVYNRWGEQVFETNDINGAWDGKYDGKPAPTGTYVYYAVVNCQGSSITIKGNVTLIR